jgi:hypothetical protein
LDWGNSVEQTSDGGYIIGGVTQSFGAGWFDFYLVRTDSLGNLLWDTTYGGTSDDFGYTAHQTLDGGYTMVGYMTMPTGKWDVYLVKTDSLGNIMWDETYGDSSLNEVCYCAQQTLDCGYIAVGEVLNPLTAGDLYLIKTDSLGNLAWDTTYGGDSADYCPSCEQTLDGGYIIAGMTKSWGSGSKDLWLIKTDSLGNLQWDTTYGGDDEESGLCVHQTSDEGYIVVGYAKSFGAGSCDVYLVKTDSLGNAQWEKTYGGTGNDIGESVQQTPDGGYIIAGYTNSFGAGGDDVYLIKTDSLGDLSWDTTYGGIESDRGYSVCQTVDGGYAITGATASAGSGVLDAFLIKTDERGRVGNQEQNPGIAVHSPELFQSIPNPFRGSTAISYSLPFDCSATLNIYDGSGRLVERLVDGRQEAGLHKIQWDTRGSPAGVYFYTLETGSVACTKKLIVVH